MGDSNAMDAHVQANRTSLTKTMNGSSMGTWSQETAEGSLNPGAGGSNSQQGSRSNEAVGSFSSATQQHGQSFSKSRFDLHKDFSAGSGLSGGHALRRPGTERTFSAPAYSRLGDLKPPTDLSHWRASSRSGRLSISGSTQDGKDLPKLQIPPYRESSANGSATPITASSLSLMIADTLQLPIATLLQLIPPQMLDPSHERFSSTALHLPVTSVEALLECYKTVNWICAKAGGPELADDDGLKGQENGTGQWRPQSDQASPLNDSPSSASPDTSRQVSGLDQAPPAAAIDVARAQQASPAPADDAERVTNFDLFELVQRVVDAVSGQAAAKNVDLVLLHSWCPTSEDGKEKKVDRAIECSVRGDEGAVRFGVMHLLSRVLAVAPAGSALHVRARPSLSPKSTADNESMQVHIDAILLTDSKVENLDLTRGSSACHAVLAGAGIKLESGEVREVKKDQSAAVSSVVNQGPFANAKSNPAGTSARDHSLWEVKHSITFLIKAGEKLVEAAEVEEAEREARQRLFPDITIGREPTLRELEHMMQEELKGKKVAVHAGPDSAFATQLSDLLRHCGCDVARLPLQDADSSITEEYWQDGNPSDGVAMSGTPRTAIALSAGRPVLVNYPSDTTLPRGSEQASPKKGPFGSKPQAEVAVLNPITGEAAPLPPNTIPMERSGSSTSSDHGIEPFSFFMIDDDIRTLQVELLRIRSALPLLQSALNNSNASSPSLAGRPGLGARLRSSPQMERVLSQENSLQVQTSGSGEPPTSSLQGSTAAIIYFTSLTNFRTVRDIVRPIAESIARGTGTTLPEIIVVPKPAGIRRLLTTLHTALHKPLVDPFFHPIATSPMSPASLGSANRYPFEQYSPKTSVSGPSAASHNEKEAVPAAEKDEPAVGTQVFGSLPSPRVERTPPSPPSLSPRTGKPHLHLGPLPSAGESMERAKSSTPKATQSGSHGLLTPGGISTDTRAQQSSSTSARSTAGGTQSKPSSPMSVDALEYFGEAASRLGSNATTGMVVQSPDGRPAGIYFRPKSNSIRSTISSRAVSAGMSAEPPGFQRHASSGSRKSTLGGNEINMPTPRGTRSGTASSVNSGTPSIGALLTPQVGIEHVLNGPAPPVVGSLPRHLVETEPRPSAGAAQPTVPATSAAAIQAATQQAKPPSTPGSPIKGEAGSPELQALRPSKLNTNVSPRTGPSTPDVMLNASPTKVKPGRNPLTQARQSFAMAQQSSRDMPRPSAQPQAGLLIGAGFTQAQRRGTGQRRAPVREAVLPPIKVLIVEDNAINIRILTRFMSRKNIQYEVANNGREAIDKWRSGSFHIIFMDIQLPVLDGISATKEIRRLERHANIGIFPGTPPAHSPSSLAMTEVNGVGSSSSSSASSLSVPGTAAATAASSPSAFKASVIIVALTASSFNSDRVAALAAGCNDFLNKPVDHKWLEKKIIEWGSMQYILLSGFVSESRWREGHAALGAATSNKLASSAAPTPRDLPKETQSSFDQIPNEQAKALATKLHIAPKKKRGSIQLSSPPLPPATASDGAGQRVTAADSQQSIAGAVLAAATAVPPLVGQPREPQSAEVDGPTVTDGVPPPVVLGSGSSEQVDK